MSGKSNESVDQFMQNIRNAVGSTKQSSSGTTDSKKESSKAEKFKNNLFTLSDDEDDVDDKFDKMALPKGVHENEFDLKAVDMLTKKIAEDLGSGFLNSDDEDEDEDEDDAEFRAQLLKEFKNLQSSSMQQQQTVIPKSRMKELYIQLLKTGSSIMTDKTAADTFMSKLSAVEMTALMDVLQMDPEQTIKYFNNDPEVIEAIKNTPSIPASASNIWKDLSEKDLLDSDDEDALDKEFQTAQKLRSKASAAVQEALKTFEENLLFYSQQPQNLLGLCDKLPTEKDQQTFLDILFREYTPERMEQKIKAKKLIEASKQQPPKADTDLVANVFKEVFLHFKAYKKHPEKFEPLLKRLGEVDSVEHQMFDSLVKAFWDIKLDKS